MKKYELKLIEKGVNKLELFFNCKDLSELKTSFKRFSKLLHPDVNKDLPDVYFKDMSNDYDEYYIPLKKEHMKENAKKYNNTNFSEDNIKEDDLNDDRFKKAIIDLLKKEGIKIELKGVWLWVSGDTKEIKEELKLLGFQWGKTARAWFMSDSKNFKKSKNRRGWSQEKTTSVYGSKVIKDDTNKKSKSTKKSKKNFIKISN